MDQPNRSDETCALDAVRGDRGAFEALVTRYGSHLQAVIERQVQDSHRALDITQDVWLKVFRALPRFRPEGTFRSWLFSIALNHLRDNVRAERRSKVVYLDDFRATSAAFAGAGATTAPNLDPRRRTEESAAIEAALAGVNEPFRTAVIMIDVMELSYEEAASTLACRVGTVKSRVNRGRLAFRDEYARLSKTRSERRESAEGNPS